MPETSAAPCGVVPLTATRVLGTERGDRIHAAAIRLDRDLRVDLLTLWPRPPFVTVFIAETSAVNGGGPGPRSEPEPPQCGLGHDNDQHDDGCGGQRAAPSGRAGGHGRAAEVPSHLRTHLHEVKMTLLVVYLVCRRREITDAPVDLLIEAGVCLGIALAAAATAVRFAPGRQAAMAAVHGGLRGALEGPGLCARTTR